MEQNGFGQNARLVFFTHSAMEADMKETVNQLSELESVKKVGSVIRVMV
jgi:homoserine dehydrogenase